MILLPVLEHLVAALIKVVCGVTAFQQGEPTPGVRQRLFYANHSSNFDFAALWAALPIEQRRCTRPVAAKDYWTASPLRRFVSEKIFRAVYVDRHPRGSTDPLEPLREALRAGDSLIIFPEGKRSLEGEVDQFKSGLFHLMQDFPELEVVPVYLCNLNRILPKGEVIPIPLISRVVFGPPLAVVEGEDRRQFAVRARQALVQLKT